MNDEATRPTSSPPAGNYDEATGRSRRARQSSHGALATLEEALAAPTPGRELSWRDKVVEALDLFLVSLDGQASADLGADSLLSEIGEAEPRLLPRVQRLHDEHRDLRESALSLRSQIATTTDDPAEVDTADIRDRLSGVARRYRQHRARESDLVYEAINVDLGGGD